MRREPEEEVVRDRVPEYGRREQNP